MRHPLAAAALLAVATALTSTGALSNAAAAGCDRACLTTYVDRYVDALVRHDPSRASLAPAVISTENGTRVRPGDGLWKTASGVRQQRETFADPGTGQWDAQIAVDTVDGRTVYASWLQNRKSDTVVARSDDLGNTWSVVVADSSNAGTDKPILAVRGPHVYVGFNHVQRPETNPFPDQLFAPTSNTEVAVAR